MGAITSRYQTYELRIKPQLGICTLGNYILAQFPAYKRVPGSPLCSLTAVTTPWNATASRGTKSAKSFVIILLYNSYNSIRAQTDMKHVWFLRESVWNEKCAIKRGSNHNRGLSFHNVSNLSKYTTRCLFIFHFYTLKKWCFIALKVDLGS